MLSTDEKDTFNAKGFVVLGGKYPPGELRALNEAAAGLIGLSGTPAAWPEDHLMRTGGQEGDVRVALHLCHRSEIFHAQAVNPSVIAAVGNLFGQVPAVLTSLLFHKPPQMGEPLAPHQDLPYYPYLGADSLITCWTALTEATEANGCVHYLEGSHRKVIAHRNTGAQQALDIEPSKLDRFTDTAVPLAAGECCLHHGLTAHYSGANQSLSPRIGVAVLYIPGDATVTLDDFPYPLLRPGSP